MPGDPIVPAGTTPYREEPYQQMDGSDFAKSNCVLAACTELVGRVTVGALRIPASRLRDISKDTFKGLTYSQAALAVLAATKNQILLEPRFGLSRDQVRDLAAAGRAFAISIDCSVTVNTARATNAFTGGHSIYVGDYEFREAGSVCRCEKNLATAHGEFNVEDPGTRARYQWWSASLLFAAAEKRGGGAINVLVGRDTEGVQRKGAMAGKLRKEARVDADEVAPVVIGQVYDVIETLNGGPWKRADGGTAFGWHKVRHNGGTAFLAGERLA
jgi:hypothetical protein